MGEQVMNVFKINKQMMARGLVLSSLALALQVQAQAPYESPERAADALVEAIALSDPAAMQRVLGPNWQRVISLDEVSAEDRYVFLEKAHQARKVMVDKSKGELFFGSDEWPLPIYLVQGKDAKWRFDPRTVTDALLDRTIGANERSAILASLAYVDAQREYAQQDRNGDGLLSYAQRLLSSKGKRDGLIWSAQLGDESPLGEAFVPSTPGGGYHGYRFKVLTEQGPNAKGGARNYVVGKHMIGGFALLAWPVRYGKTGVMSFIVNQDGQVFEQDLGPTTEKTAATIKSFDPGPGWKVSAP
jgi:hypothetical protein